MCISLASAEAVDQQMNSIAKRSRICTAQTAIVSSNMRASITCRAGFEVSIDITVKNAASASMASTAVTACACCAGYAGRGVATVSA